MRTTTLLALALPLFLGNLAAQEPIIVKVGDLVRLTAPAAGIDSLEGTIADFRGDILYIQPANRRERYLFPLRSLTSVTILEAAPAYQVRVSTATQPSEPAWVVGALVSTNRPEARFSGVSATGLASLTRGSSERRRASARPVSRAQSLTL